MRRTAADAEITRQELLADARAAFASQGYAGTQPAEFGAGLQHPASDNQAT